ncbi:MAG: lactonase family protein [Burkholderiales bacterium]|nr:lactonase family protein [Burkholderiales bacterium]
MPGGLKMACAVYVSNEAGGEVVVLRLEQGRLEVEQRVEIGGVVMPLALSPDGRFLYAARRSDPLAVLSFAVEPGRGRLRLIGIAPLPESMPYIACDRSGRFLLAASYGGNQVSVSAIAPEGVAEAAQQVLPTPPKAHAIRADRANRFVWASSLGGDCLLRWRFDAAGGALDAGSQQVLAMRPGSGPRHFVWDASGRHLYVLGELDGSLAVHDCSDDGLAERQVVSTLPPGFDAKPWAADLHLAPDGRHLVASERRSGTLALFAVDPADGSLAPRGSFDTEANPRGFAFDPTGRWLIAAGQDSGALRLFAFEGETLESRQTLALGGGPNWVETLALD